MSFHILNQSEKPQETVPPGRRRAAIAVAVAVVLYGVVTCLHSGSEDGWIAFADIGELLAAGAATIACAIRARRVRAAHARVRERSGSSPSEMTVSDSPPQKRIAWPLLTLGVGCWTAGELYTCVYEIGLGAHVPEPSPADAGFLLSYAFIICGLLAFVRTPAGVLSRLRGAVEGLFMACGFVLCSWSLVIGSVYEQNGTLTFRGAVNLAYPMLDAVALATVFFVALQRRLTPPAGLGLLACGIALLSIADSGWWYVNEVNANAPSVSPFQAGWVAGFALIAFAALRTGAPERAKAPRPLESGFALALPSLPAMAGMLIVLSVWLFQGHVGSQDTLLGIMGLDVLLGLVLLLLVTYENHALTSDLEHRVQERTAALNRAERYYRALVQHSSDLVIVLNADLTIREVSDSALTVLGYRPEELTGRGLDVFGPDAMETLAGALARVSPGGDQLARVQWNLTDHTGRCMRAESTITNLLADPQVGGFVLNTRDDTDRAALADQLRRQAFHDPLTGLANRALLDDRTTQALARSQRTGSEVAIIAIDLDAFKLVNDGFGHRTGDVLLCAVSQRLRAAVRPGDTVARIGGDEFVVLMDPAPNAANATALAERIHKALLRDVDVEGTAHRPTASIGVALGGTPQTDFEQLLSDASVALYCVKQAGKNSIQLFQPSMNLNARERFKLQADLRRALEHDELTIFYQSEVDVSSGELDGFEALVRWMHPKHGLMPPDSFIPLAEQTGLVVPLGRWVLKEALAQAMRWSDAHVAARSLIISVNVSAVQLKAPSIIGDVRDALAESGIDPARVVLEMTESSFIESSEEIIDTLHALKTLGVRLAIDDFGTGYASIANLQSMPIDVVKVDKRFLASCDDGGHGRELLKAILNIGRVLSLVTIAEGIEQQTQLETARELDCDLAQGYLFSRPVPADQAEQMIVAEATTRRALEAATISGAVANPPMP
jgi:diguanylate cyclase (GGDEF)-like protein/PAS domain S-box-containing protein